MTINYLNANPPNIGVRSEEVTMHIHGETYRMTPNRARSIAHRLETKANIADGRGGL